MKRTLLLLTMAAISLTGCAQNSSKDYFVGKNFVSYNDSLMTGADVQTFMIMAHGYAKDCQHVYYNGKVLEYADPATFSLTDRTTQDSLPEHTAREIGKESTAKPKAESEDKASVLDIVLGTDTGTNKYAIEGKVVSYDGKVIKKADAASFKYVGGEYAADKHHAYYKGNILGDAWGTGLFNYKGNGYATDGLHWYCNGKPVDRD